MTLVERSRQAATHVLSRPAHQHSSARQYCTRKPVLKQERRRREIEIQRASWFQTDRIWNSGSAVALRPFLTRLATSPSSTPLSIMSDNSILQLGSELQSGSIQFSIQAPDHSELDDAIYGHGKTNQRRPSENGDVVEIDELYFKTMLEQLRGAVPAGYDDSTQPPTIFKVPEELKSTNILPVEDRPVAVWLGRPSREYMFCPGSRRLQKYKWCCTRQLINRHSRLMEPARTPVLLNECFTSMKRLVPRISASYCEETMVTVGVRARSDNDVALTMLKDGCFILHRLLKYARRAKMEADGGGGGDRFGEDDEDWTQVYGRCFVWHFVTRDMLLLENQIPFFVIRELFQQLRNEDEPEELLVAGGLRLFRSLRPQMLHRSPIACDDVHHLLHLFYLSVGLPPTDRHHQQQHRRSEDLLSELPQWVPCAKELEEAGIRFRTRRNATSFLDIKFARGMLEVPQLELNDSSETLFRNLIAFEQTYPDTPRDISTYAVFMNCLVTSPEDMRILDLHGILVNHLNNRKAAWRFFSDIVAQVHWSADNYLVGLMDAVNRYRNRRRHRWRAALVRNYFSNPWVTMSVFAALLLLAMAMLQTFFTVYAYFKPPNPK